MKRLTAKAIEPYSFVDEQSICGKETVKVEYNHAVSSNYVYMIIAKLCNKLGTFEDVCEDILNWTDGRIENTDTVIITLKSSEKLLKLLEELE